MNRKQRKQAQIRATPAPAPVTPTSQRVSVDAVLGMRARPATTGAKTAEDVARLFRPAEPGRGVLPVGTTGQSLAMDAGFSPDNSMDFGLLANINGAFNQGYAWPGFPILSEWAQVSEFRKPVETYAREMTREWIELTSTGDEDKTEKLAKLDAEFKRLNVQSVFRKAMQHDGFYGRGQIFLDMGMESDSLQPDELKTELVESNAKVGLGSLKRLTVVDANFSYPNRYNANDPLDPTFYKPISWYVMGKEVHSSRLITVVTREVPDILKPAYAFAGLSLSQMLKPYVDNWLRTRQSVSDLIHSFTVWTLSTDMSALLNNGGAESFFNRLQIFNLGRDNHGVNAINGATEKFENISAPLGGLDALQAQSQEQMAAPSGVPLVYLTGITPAGLNATSEGEIRVFQDNCAANQEIWTPALSKILNIAQLSLFGEIDPDIGFKWNPLYSMSELELANTRKIEAETDVVYVDAGILAPDEVRTRIAGQEDSAYHGLDLNADITPPEEEVTGAGIPAPHMRANELEE